MSESTQQTTARKEVSQPSERITRLKTAFLYVLIGGLAASAITSVIALLIGQFNSAILKSLLTIFVFFTHALFILALLWADRRNQVGKLLLPTAIIVLAFSNLITTILGTWEIISAETAWRAVGLYILILGGVFIAIGALRLRVAHQATQIALFSTIGLVAATILSLVPWVLDLFGSLDPLYFRIVSALAILTSASFLIGLILRGIAVGRRPELKETAPASHQIPGGLLAIYITLGSLAAIVWSVGLTGFIVSGVEASNPHPTHKYDRYY